MQKRFPETPHVDHLWDRHLDPFTKKQVNRTKRHRAKEILKAVRKGDSEAANKL